MYHYSPNARYLRSFNFTSFQVQQRPQDILRKLGCQLRYQETNSKEIAPTKEREVASDYRTNDKPSSNTNDPLKRNIYFLNKVSPKHKPHTNYKIMSQQHDDRDYPDYNLYENDDSELYYDDM